MNFTVKLEQMDKKKQKLEKRAELGRVNFFYQNPENIPTYEQTLNLLDSTNNGARVGFLQVSFDYVENEA